MVAGTQAAHTQGCGAAGPNSEAMSYLRLTPSTALVLGEQEVGELEPQGLASSEVKGSVPRGYNMYI